MMNIQRIVIAGGAGFVGSNLAMSLKHFHSDWQIIALDNLRRRGSELNVRRLNESGIRFIHADIRCEDDLLADDLRCDIVVDCSAEPSVLAGYSQPRYVIQTNLMGTVNLLELARRHQAGFVFLSTSRVYPINRLEQVELVENAKRFDIAKKQSLAGVDIHGIAENFDLTGYRSIYGATKLAGEHLTVEYANAFDVPAVINRCGVIAGPWQLGKVDQGVFTLWLARHHFQIPLKYIGFGGSGKQVRDLLHVDDLCDLVELQLSDIDNLHGDVFNVGGGQSISLSLLETTELCQQITGNTIEIDSVPANRPGDIALYVTNTQNVQQRFGWAPKHHPDRILRDTYQWLLQHESMLKGIVG